MSGIWSEPMQSKSVLISRFTLQISILQSISSFAVSYVFAKFFATTFASKFEIFLAIDAGYFFVLLFALSVKIFEPSQKNNINHIGR